MFLSNVEYTQAIDCYKCGIREAKPCEDFDPENLSYKESCPSNISTCIKTMGTYGNISGMGTSIVWVSVHQS